jgi:large subunit ribosomal protein L24
MKIRRNDIVKILAGKDKGKSGKVLRIYPQHNKAIVEGINYIKKHARRTQDNPQGGIVQKENPIQISNLAIICPRCSKPARIGFSILADKSKVRFCKKCNETI